MLFLVSLYRKWTEKFFLKLCPSPPFVHLKCYVPRRRGAESSNPRLEKVVCKFWSKLFRPIKLSPIEIANESYLVQPWFSCTLDVKTYKSSGGEKCTRRRYAHTHRDYRSQKQILRYCCWVFRKTCGYQFKVLSNFLLF